MRSFAVSAIGLDRPGVVAALTRVLLSHALNVEDAQATILRGHFSLTMIVSGGEHISESQLQTALEDVRDRFALEAIVAREVELSPHRDAVATHVVRVLGLDRPGIVHAVCQTLADSAVSIVDMYSRLTPDDQPTYAMQLEISLPSADQAEALEHALQDIAAHGDFDVRLEQL